MSQPRFTVVTPTFNQGAYIEKTIDSVLSQGYADLEFIVIDGGSRDATVDVIRRYEKHLAYWVSEPDRGQSHAINKGLARATGTYCTWLNSDDCYLPGALARLSDAFEANATADVIVGAGRIVNEAGQEVYRRVPGTEITLESMYHWLDGGDFMQPSSAFRAQAWQRVGGLDERIHIALDVDLWLRMAKSGSKFAVVPELLSEALSHPEAKTTAFQQQAALDCAIVVLRHGGEQVARPRLDEMAEQLAWFHGNYARLSRHPLGRLLRPWLKQFMKPGLFKAQTPPPWATAPQPTQDGPARQPPG